MKKHQRLRTCAIFAFFTISTLAIYTITCSYYSYISYAGLIEVREYCNTLLGKNIADGTYFSLQYFPQNLYLYGPLQGIVLSVMPEITLNTNRSLSCLFLLSTIIPIYVISSKIFCSHSKLLVFQYAFLSYIATIFVCTRDLYINPGRPDQIGLLIYFSAFATVLSRIYQNAPPFTRGVVTSLITCLSLLTKQYFGVVLLLFYAIELTNSKDFRSKAVYFSTSVASIVLFFISTYQFIPVYFMSYFHHINVASYSLAHQLNQSLGFLQNTSIFCALSIASFFVYNKRKRDSTGGQYLPIALFLLATILIVLFKLGGHRGNYMVYYNQLIFPPLIIISMFTISTFKSKLTPLLSLIALTIVITSNAKHVTNLEEKGNIYSSSQSNPVGLQNNTASSKAFICPTALHSNTQITYFTEIDGGQLEYINTLGYPSILNYIFPRLKNAKNALYYYEKSLLVKIRNKEFDIIYYDECCILTRFRNELNEFYEKFNVNNRTIYTSNETISERIRLNYSTN